MHYLVYRATSPSGKVYIGMTKKTLHERKLQHFRRAKKDKRIFYDAIKKYGKESFVWEVLVDGLSLQQAKDKEIELIKVYKSIDRNYGYNLTKGGDTGNIVTEVSKEKLRSSMKKYWESSEFRQNMSESKKKSLQENPESGHGLLVGFKNQTHKANFQEASKKWREDPDFQNLAAKSKGCKPFVCIQTGEEFISKSVAAKKLNIDRVNLYKALKTGKPIKGFTFKYV